MVERGSLVVVSPVQELVPWWAALESFPSLPQMDCSGLPVEHLSQFEEFLEVEVKVIFLQQHFHWQAEKIFKKINIKT